ncbi:hypothetical protein F5Y17DRAFT_302100 [Xylariaceae sp. FL0594]|nr:hypothetical protein F5Y17DRAFT_302100 [Xylariaceae sp. FL0594]
MADNDMPRRLRAEGAGGARVGVNGARGRRQEEQWRRGGQEERRRRQQREGQEEEESDEDDDDDDDPSNDPPLPPWLDEYICYWHGWYVTIVHKSANVAVRRPFRYTEGYARPRPPHPYTNNNTTSTSPFVLYNRNAVVDPFSIFSPSPPSSESEEEERSLAPFPFNMQPHHHCAILVLLILGLHVGGAWDYSKRSDDGWLFSDTRALWVGRVLYRSFLTLAISVASTAAFEIAGEYVCRKTRWMMDLARDTYEELLFVRVLGWAEIERQGEGGGREGRGRRGGGQFAWRRGDAAMRPCRECVRDMLSGIFVYVFEYFLVVAWTFGTKFLSAFATSVLVPALGFLVGLSADFLMGIPSHLALPTPQVELHVGGNPMLTLPSSNSSSLPLPSAGPESDTVTVLRTLYLEYGIPLLVQFFLVILLWFAWFLCLAKAERFALFGYRVEDPRSALAAHLVRATSMHLVAYTAYQGVLLLLLGFKLYIVNIPSALSHILYSGHFLRLPLGLNPANVLASLLLLAAHWVIRRSARFVVVTALGEAVFSPYLVWLTRFSREGARSLWPALTHPLDDEVNKMLNARKRVVSRVLMTAVFGLESSWPARMHLSNAVGDD